MSYVIATPEMMATAAFDLARIGSQVSAASAVAAMPTTEVVAAGADEVSAGIAALFSAHAQEYQALSAQAAAFHDQFVHTLTAAARWYTATEIANAAAMRVVLGAVNAPTQTLLGRPLIGDGAHGTAPGQPGGAGGLLFGNGGNGAAGAVGQVGGAAGRPGYLGCGGAVARAGRGAPAAAEHGIQTAHQNERSPPVKACAPAPDRTYFRYYQPLPTQTRARSSSSGSDPRKRLNDTNRRADAGSSRPDVRSSQLARAATWPSPPPTTRRRSSPAAGSAPTVAGDRPPTG